LERQNDVGLPVEIIVVDDGSTDDTAAVARRFKGVKVRSQENAGPAAARNHGAREARGNLLVFVDADCEPAADWLRELTRPLLADESVVAAKGVYRTRQRRWAARFAQLEFEGRYRLLARARQIAFVDSYSAAIRAEAFRAVGGFDPHFPLADNEDVDLSFKLARSGFKMVFCPRAIVYHVHADTWRRYLGLKLRRAYWRARVYRRFPERMLSDNYTPQLLKFQVLLMAAFLPWAAAAFWWRPAAWGALAAAALFLVSAAPFLATVFARDPLLLVAAIPAVAARAFVFAVGGIAGFLSRRRFDLLFPTLYILADALVIIGLVHGVFWLRSRVFTGFLDPIYHPLFVYQRAGIAVLGIWVLIFAFMGLYHTSRTTTFMAEGMKVFRAIFLAAVATMAAAYLAKFEYSRVIMASFFAAAVPFALATRYGLHVLKDRMQIKGYYQTRVIVVGGGEAGLAVAERMKRAPRLGYRLVGFVDDRPPETEAAGPYLGKPSVLPSLVTQYYVDEVIIAKLGLAPEKVLELVTLCDHTGVAFRVIYSALKAEAGTSELRSIADIPVLDFTDAPFQPVKRFVKRVADLLFVYTTAPFWVPLTGLLTFIMVLVRKGPPWTAVVTQGRDGVPFSRWDIRTDGAGAYGRFLERTALYRLPWASAVAEGDMSLVGPRPCRYEEGRRLESWKRYRFRMKPGMTGFWLVISRADMPAEAEIEFDLYYVKNQSVILDAAIVLRTLGVVLSGRAAPKPPDENTLTARRL
jgi:lipopolysaccharide/colanic/teichoic acid biosynthesis glycosyltransferase/GT2 family glycosyltransferase